MKCFPVLVFLIQIIQNCIFAQPSLSSKSAVCLNTNLNTVNFGQMKMTRNEGNREGIRSVLNNSSDLSKNNFQIQNRPNSISDCLQNESRIVLGLNSHYFSYEEKINDEDIRKQFEDQFGRQPDTIKGRPKSTEYGPTVGLNIAYVKRFEDIGFFIFPQCELNMGIRHTYSGSSQALPIFDSSGDTIGVQYDPLDTTKNNLFFSTALCFGYNKNSVKMPFTMYSGIRMNIWKRDMLSNIYVTNFERYLWITIPVGFAISKSLRSSGVLSLECVLDFMFFGNMQIVLRSQGYDLLNFPAVTLGNKCGYSIKLSYAKKVRNALSIEISPFASFYGFGKSNTGKATGSSTYPYEEENYFEFYEPESSTYKLGLNLLFNIITTKSS